MTLNIIPETSNITAWTFVFSSFETIDALSSVLSKTSAEIEIFVEYSVGMTFL